MEENKKYAILKYSLFFFLVFSGALAWFSIERAIFAPGASVWSVPLIAFTLYIILIYLAIYIIKERSILNLGLALSLAASLMFCPSSYQAAVLALVFILVWIGEFDVEHELKNRVKFEPGWTMRRCHRLIIWGLCLAIAGQYHFSTKDLATEKYMPHLQVSPELSKMILRTVTRMIPDLRNMDFETITVDQFVWEAYRSRNPVQNISVLLSEQGMLGGAAKEITPEKKAEIERTVQAEEKQSVLAAGRKQLSELAGIPINGSEKMADIFSRLADKRLNSFFVPGLGRSESSSLFSGIIALVILLTTISLASFLMLVWNPLMGMIFYFLKKSGAVTVSTISVEREVIN